MQSTLSDYVFQTKYGKHCHNVIDDSCVKLLYFEFQQNYESCAKIVKEIYLELQRLAEMPEANGEFTKQELYEILKREFDSQLMDKRDQYLNQKIAPSK